MHCRRPFFNAMALRHMMIGRAKGQFEPWQAYEDTESEKGFVNFLNEVRGFARRHKLESSAAAGNPAIDVDQVRQHAES